MRAAKEAKSKSSGFWQECAAIISSARRRAGLGVLADGDLESEIRDWVEILGPIPDGYLRDCYLHAQRSRTVRAMLQPGEIIAAWQERRGSLAARTAPINVDQGESCYYCDGAGWQTVAYIAESENENTGVRACACSAAPLEVRSLQPYREPEWQKRKHSVIWERVT